jgi:hypothetical protein
MDWIRRLIVQIELVGGDLRTYTKLPLSAPGSRWIRTRNREFLGPSSLLQPTAERLLLPSGHLWVSFDHSLSLYLTSSVFLAVWRLGLDAISNDHLLRIAYPGLALIATSASFIFLARLSTS